MSVLYSAIPPRSSSGRCRVTPGIRRKFALALVIVQLAGCAQHGVVQISDFQARQRPMPESIVLVSWNVQKGGDPDFETDLVRMIIAEKPDLVFLQEARADLLKSNRIGGLFASSWSYPWPDGTTVGVLTLSHVAPVAVTPLRSRTREFFVTAPKMSLVTEYPLANGERLMTVNVHLLAFERWRTAGIGAQLDELEQVMRDHVGPIILAGDFNTWSRDRLELVSRLALRLELSEVNDFPPGRKTGDNQSAFLNWLFGVDPVLPLDRVYCRGFSHHSAEVLTYDTSDHPAIRVTLEATPPFAAQRQ